MLFLDPFPFWIPFLDSIQDPPLFWTLVLEQRVVFYAKESFFPLFY